MGIGRRLLGSVLEKASQHSAKAVYLVTNKKLKEANHLYHNFGFRETSQYPIDISQYKRPSIVMELIL
jgi:N-acetylglutamate synthase-like GNAT family acetyltransferase